MKIVTVSDLIKILDTKENRYGVTGKPRMLDLSLNGIFAGSIESVKLDGYGDGLVKHFGRITIISSLGFVSNQMYF